MEKSYNKKGMDWKYKVFMFIVTVALVAITITLFVFNSKINANDRTNELGRKDYEKGLLSAEGGEVKGTTAIRSKEYVPTRGLNVDYVENSGVKYVIFFYDNTQTFISATEELTEDFDAKTTPENAIYARVMITPLYDPEVSRAEIKEYASALLVEWSK